MWGKPADTYGEKERIRYGTSHKWHLVDPDSLEQREIKSTNWYTKDLMIKRTFGAFMCGGKTYEWHYYDKYGKKWRDERTPLILRDEINLNGSGVCYYCKKHRLKEMGKNDKVMG